MITITMKDKTVKEIKDFGLISFSTNVYGWVIINDSKGNPIFWIKEESIDVIEKI